MNGRRSIVLRSHLRSVDGLTVAVQVQGAGPPLLLINGITRPLQSWAPLTRELPGRTLVSFDAPGVGASPTPPVPLSMRGLAAVAVGVLDATTADEHGPAADVLGYSHGGAVAQQLVEQSPGRVRRLVLAATSCGLGATVGYRQPPLRSLGVGQGALPWPGTDKRGLLWQSLAISSWSSIPFLGAITAPTLVVCGDRDRLVPQANSRLLARRIPGAALVILTAGHELQRGAPVRALARAVEQFLPKNPSLTNQGLNYA